MKNSNKYTVEEVKTFPLMKLQKAAKDLKVSFSMGMKQKTLLNKVVKAIDLQEQPQKQLPILEALTVEMVKEAKSVKVLKEYAKFQGLAIKSNTKRQDIIDALIVSIKPMPKLETAKTPPPVEGAVQLRELKEGSKFSFIRAGKACKAVYTLVKKTATEAISSDDGVEWTAKILGYNVIPVA